MDTDVQVLAEQAMRLRLEIEHLAGMIEQATVTRRQALAHYPRLRRLLRRCLIRAAAEQARATYFAQELHRQRGRLLALQRQVEALAFFGAEGLDGIAADLRVIAGLIEAWATAPDPAAKGKDTDGGGQAGDGQVEGGAK